MKKLSNIMRFTSFTGQEEMNPNFTEESTNITTDNKIPTEGGVNQDEIKGTPTEVKNGGRIRNISNFEGVDSGSM
jgi:hypothetical protein